MEREFESKIGFSDGLLSEDGKARKKVNKYLQWKPFVNKNQHSFHLSSAKGSAKQGHKDNGLDNSLDTESRVKECILDDFFHMAIEDKTYIVKSNSKSQSRMKFG